MKKTILFNFIAITIICCFSNIINAQDAKVVKNNYARNSLTMLVLDYGDSPYLDYFKSQNKLTVPDKFDDNNLNYSNLPANFTRDQMIDRKIISGISMGVKNQMNTTFIEPLYHLVINNKIPNAIIAKEFNRQPDGTFNMDVIAERGMYDADETDYQKAQATMRKDNALRDAGEILLNNSYILIFDFKSIKTMTEIYNTMDAKSTKPVVRTQNGYKASGNAYLYKIDFNDSVYNNFLLSLWLDAQSDVQLKQDRAILFDNTTFPIIRVACIPFESEALQYNADQGILAPKVQKTTEQLFGELVTSARDGSITNIEKLFSQFRIKSQITSVHPIGVKVGTKEGLKLDQRYFVYETQLDGSGQQFSKRMGVIRSKKIVENRFKVSDKQGKFEPSLFYQTAGKSLSNMGMYVEQKNDLGFGLLFAYNAGYMGGLNLALEYNITSLINAATNSKSGITALKIYIGGGFDTKLYDSQSLINTVSEESILFYRIEGGIAKDFYFARNFHISPVIGMGMESAGLTEDYYYNNNIATYSLQTLYANIGVRLGVNILHNLQFQVMVNIMQPFGTVTEDITQNNTSISGYPQELTNAWDEIFLNRSGLGFGGGLRLQF